MEIIIYCILLGLLATPLSSLIFIGIMSLLEKLGLDNDKFLVHWGLVSFIFLSILSGCLLVFWFLSSLGIYPSNYRLNIKNEVVEEQFQILEQKADELSRMFESTENLKISELPRIAQDTLELAGELKQKFQEQQELVLKLRSRVEEETARAAEAQRLAQEVQSLTKSQLDAVKLLITEDAKTEANLSFIKGVIVSFPLGIIASFIASIIYSRWSS